MPFVLTVVSLKLLWCSSALWFSHFHSYILVISNKSTWAMTLTMAFSHLSFGSIFFPHSRSTSLSIYPTLCPNCSCLHPAPALHPPIHSIILQAPLQTLFIHSSLTHLLSSSFIYLKPCSSHSNIPYSFCPCFLEFGTYYVLINSFRCAMDPPWVIYSCGSVVASRIIKHSSFHLQRTQTILLSVGQVLVLVWCWSDWFLVCCSSPDDDDLQLAVKNVQMLLLFLAMLFLGKGIYV